MKSKIPLIGLTSSNGRKTTNIYTPKAYIDAVIAAGGLPLLIPPETKPDQVMQLRETLDGILIIGGSDIDPALYGAETHSAVQLDGRPRDDFEIALVRAAVETGWPLFGICRGLQVINVAMGGTLYTHIPDQLPKALTHNQNTVTHRSYLAHEVTFQSSARITEIMDCQQVHVNSLHHQGICRLGAGLTATGASPDGLIESIEIPSHPFAVGVQWHPECLPDLPPMGRLFEVFVEKAASNSK